MTRLPAPSQHTRQTRRPGRLTCRRAACTASTSGPAAGMPAPAPLSPGASVTPRDASCWIQACHRHCLCAARGHTISHASGSMLRKSSSHLHRVKFATPSGCKCVCVWGNMSCHDNDMHRIACAAAWHGRVRTLGCERSSLHQSKGRALRNVTLRLMFQSSGMCSTVVCCSDARCPPGP
jgi:hypothetical protein